MEKVTVIRVEEKYEKNKDIKERLLVSPQKPSSKYGIYILLDDILHKKFLYTIINLLNF